jgi:UPF0755 protein
MNNYQIQRPRRRWTKILGAFLVIAMLAIGSAVFVLRREYMANLQPVSPSQHNQLVTIAKGTTAHDVAVDLSQKGLIRSVWAFEWYLRNNNLRDKLQAGSYYLRPNMTTPEVVNVLTQGKVATDMVTILPAQRLSQIRQSLINNGFKAADVDAALNPALYKDHAALADKPVGANLEGYLYPDTFQKTVDTKPEEIIRNSLDLMQKYLTPEVRAGFVKHGLTVHQGVTIASIVEQEVSKLSDRPVVAQVFLKRLKEGMPLGADPTAFYGAIIANQPPTVFYDSPYNTRIHPGIPPGPISNVSETSLKAVASPANTDYLYFVAGDNGVTYFSHTVEQHEALTRQHCKKLCS